MLNFRKYVKAKKDKNENEAKSASVNCICGLEVYFDMGN